MILVVDDDDSVRQVLIDMLRSSGYEAWGEQNGRDALAYLTDDENERPELILLDYSMPVMNGEEFLIFRDIDPRLKAIPVIVFTGSVDLVNNKSADGYVQKPFVSQVMPFVEKYCVAPAA